MASFSNLNKTFYKLLKRKQVAEEVGVLVVSRNAVLSDALKSGICVAALLIFKNIKSLEVIFSCKIKNYSLSIF